jgi:hypothetical protein
MAAEANGTRAGLETLRAADADRQQVADQLKDGLEEGRLSLHEYDERVALAYAARTYAELLTVVADLPRRGLSAAEMRSRRAALARRAARRIPTTLLVLWTIWAAVVAANLALYGIVQALAIWRNEGGVHPWPVWLLVPAAPLAAVTVGVQVIRRHRRDEA